MIPRIACLCLAIWCTAAGCASFSTTPLSRLDGDAVSGESNGKPSLFCRSRPYKGVPVKIKVQSHVDVWIEEKYALVKQSGRWREAALGRRLLSVRTEPVFSEKVIVCDFKRPASGSLDLTVDFTDDAYFDKISSALSDTTITDAAALFTTVFSKFAVPTSADQANPSREIATVMWMTKTVAYQRFDINATDYEQRLDAFVDQHLNSCDACGQTPLYDATSGGGKPTR